MTIEIQQGRKRQILVCKTQDCASEELKPIGSSVIPVVGAVFSELRVVCDKGHESRFLWMNSVRLRRLEMGNEKLRR